MSFFNMSETNHLEDQKAINDSMASNANTKKEQSKDAMNAKSYLRVIRLGQPSDYTMISGLMDVFISMCITFSSDIRESILPPIKLGSQSEHIRCQSHRIPIETTRGDGSCGFRALLSTILNTIYNIIIPKDYSEFYKRIIDLKLIYINFIKLLFTTGKISKREYLVNCHFDNQIYINFEVYCDALLEYDYMLSEYELRYFINMISTAYPQFSYVNFIICTAKATNNVPMLCTITNDAYYNIIDFNPYIRSTHPTIILYNGHFSQVIANILMPDLLNEITKGYVVINN